MWKRDQDDLCLFGWWNEMVEEKRKWMGLKQKIDESLTEYRKGYCGKVRPQREKQYLDVWNSNQLLVAMGSSPHSMTKGAERRLSALFDCLIYEISWPKIDSQWFHLWLASCLNCDKVFLLLTMNYFFLVMYIYHQDLLFKFDAHVNQRQKVAIFSLCY